MSACVAPDRGSALLSHVGAEIIEEFLRLVPGFLGMATYRDDQIPATRYRLEGLRTYEVLVDDFERIEQEASQVGNSLQFATACVPVGITLTIQSQQFHTSHNDAVTDPWPPQL